MGLRFAIALLLLGAGAARADDDKARDRFNEGRGAFEAGKFADAAKAFEEAYAISSKPALLWNIAQAYRRIYEVGGEIGSLKRAREVYRNFAELAETEKERGDAKREAEATDALLKEAERKAAADEAQRREASRPVVVAAPAVESAPFYKKAWFWVVVAAVVVVGAATGITLAATSDRTPRTQGGNWAPFGPLVSW